MEGACGKMKRMAALEGKCSSFTTGTKSLPSAPSPCNQMTAASALRSVDVSRVMWGSKLMAILSVISICAEHDYRRLRIQTATVPSISASTGQPRRCKPPRYLTSAAPASYDRQQTVTTDYHDLPAPIHQRTPVCQAPWPIAVTDAAQYCTRRTVGTGRRSVATAVAEPRSGYCRPHA